MLNKKAQFNVRGLRRRGIFLNSVLLTMRSSANGWRIGNYWNAEKAQAEAIFAEEKRRNSAESEAQAQAVQQERLRLEELDRRQREQANADARAKDARIQELSNELRNSQLKHEKFADDTLKNISNLEGRLRQDELSRSAAAENNVSNQDSNTVTFGPGISSISPISSVSPSQSPGLTQTGSLLNEVNLPSRKSTLVLPKMQHLHNQLVRLLYRHQFRFQPLHLRRRHQPSVSPHRIHSLLHVKFVARDSRSVCFSSVPNVRPFWPNNNKSTMLTLRLRCPFLLCNILGINRRNSRCRHRLLQHGRCHSIYFNPCLPLCLPA